MDFLTERNMHIYEDYFKFNKRRFLIKRILIALLFLVLGYLLYVVTSNNWLLVAMPVMAFLGYKLPYIELISRKNKDDIIKQYMFPTFLRYFISLLDTQGNVFQTLKAIIPYVDEPIKTEVIKMVTRLEEQNVNNRDAFMDFAEYIGSSEAHMIMGMIFEFNEEGINKDDAKELENTIKELQENKTNELIEQKVHSLDKHANPIMVYGLAYVFMFTGILFVSYFKTLPL